MPYKTKLLNPAVRDALIAAYYSGTSTVDACREAGISCASLTRYEQRGREDHDAGKDTVYSRFWEDVLQARKSMAYVCVNRIRNTIENSDDERLATDAAFKWLEHSRRTRWANVAGTGDADDAEAQQQPVLEVVEFATEDEMRAYLDAKDEDEADPKG